MSLKLFYFSQRNENKHENTINVLLQYFSPLKKLNLMNLAKLGFNTFRL